MSKKVKITKSKPLTKKQAKFVEYVLSGDNYVDAYVKAFEVDTEARDIKSIRTSANQVRARASVAKALREGEAIVNVHNVVWTKEQALKELTDILEQAKSSIQDKGLNKVNVDLMLGTIKELNAISGVYYKDQKRYEADMKKIEVEQNRLKLEETKVQYVIEGPKADVGEDDDKFLEALENASTQVWEVVDGEGKPVNN